ncbi:unnamed protein product [Oncorhynchus mykiss]|uniref:Uncharacterized protein n=1 Tax=Oncorhynchus mykiss TaxID=8022 RepID=A0A060XB65_ONCMY|nr:unnamed protein product [Oncorhynchus mykiss]
MYMEKILTADNPSFTLSCRCRSGGNSRARWFSCQVLQLHSSTSSHQQLQGVTIAQLLQSGNSANRCETAVPGHHGVPVLLHLHLQQPDLSYPGQLDQTIYHNFPSLHALADSNVEAVDVATCRLGIHCALCPGWAPTYASTLQGN